MTYTVLPNPKDATSVKTRRMISKTPGFNSLVTYPFLVALRNVVTSGDFFTKNSKFLDLRPTTPKHEMFYHFKSHLSM